MNALLSSLMIGLFSIFNIHPVTSRADNMGLSSEMSPPAHHLLRTVRYAPLPTEIVEAAPATSLTYCDNAQESSLTLRSSDLPAEGPTCVPVSSQNTAGSDGREPQLLFPFTSEGASEERMCVVITTPQIYCDIPSGSSLSAFPLV